MITTVDNFKDTISSFAKDKNHWKGNERYRFDYKKEKEIKENINITYEQYSKNKKNKIFQISNSRPDKNDLIFSLSHFKDSNDEKKYKVEVGNYIGKFKYGKVEINIKSRFSDEFLNRMLNFADDVFLDDVSIFKAEKDKKKDSDYAKLIIYYMFIQKLEKASLLGFPKSYKAIKHHNMKFKGRIDINRFIKYDIPFRGKVSCISNEQKEIQEVIDVLYKAISIIEENGFTTKSISHIKTHLKKNRSNKPVSNITIAKAIKSKALQNPIFSIYRKVLEYAKFIINVDSLKDHPDGNTDATGFLVDVSLLFEAYVTKLLKKEFPDWIVESREEETYGNMFFKRKIIPDIVMMKDKDVMVFDTKYKKMLFRGRNRDGPGDVDRTDFFQINTYMSYYKNHPDKYNVKAGGLLYPFEENASEDKCHSQDWFGESNTKFIVDGIGNLSEENPNFPVIEERFVERIRNL